MKRRFSFSVDSLLSQKTEETALAKSKTCQLFKEAFYCANLNVYWPVIGQKKCILACHWSIKMYTGLPLVNYSVYWPIIGHLYCMTSFIIGTIKSFLFKENNKRSSDEFTELNVDKDSGCVK